MKDKDYMEYDIQDLRTKLDALDEQLIALLAERFQVTEQVGEYKKAHDLPPVDTNRESEQFIRIRELANKHQLDPIFAERMLRLIIDTVVVNHKEIATR